MKRLALLLAAAGALALGCGDKKKPEPAAGGPSTAAQASDAAPAQAPQAPRKLLSVGARVPAFSMPAHTGETIDSEALRGQKLVLYFYPKDETPG